MQDWDAFLDRAEHLPPAPRILPALLAKLAQPETDNREIVELISYDPVLTAKVMQVCNSVLLGGAAKVDSLLDAATRVGFHTLFFVVASAVGTELLRPSHRESGIDAGRLWKHSVLTALASQVLAHDRGDNESVVFTAGLLHDLGKIVLAEVLREDYARLLKETAENQHALLYAERAALHMDHAEVGAQLLKRWNFSPALVNTVAFHHHPDGAGEQSKMASYVYCADMMAHFLGHDGGPQPFSARGREDAFAILGLTDHDLARYTSQTLECFDMVDALCVLHS